MCDIFITCLQRYTSYSYTPIAALQRQASKFVAASGGSEIAPCSPDEMRRIMVAEIELYREMMKVAGIEPE